MKRNKLFLVVVACALLISCAFAAIVVNAAETARLTVNASNGEVQIFVNDELQSVGEASAVLKVPVGAKVKLVATDGTNEFLFWTDNVLNTVQSSDVRTISFTMTSEALYTAWFAPSEGSLVIYQNSNTTKQILASAIFANANEFTAHLAEKADKHGNTFTDWAMDVNTISSKIGVDKVITVEPVYEENISSCNITVVGGTISGTDGATTGVYDSNTVLSLVADTAPEGQTFVAWKDSKGNVISNLKTLTVKAERTETYTAEFSADAKVYEPYAKLTLTPVTDGIVRSRLNFFVGHNTLVEYGLIYAKNNNLGEEALSLGNVDGTNVKKASFTTPGGILVNHFENVEKVSARAYVTYTDADSVTTTVYSNVAWSDVAELLELKHELRVDENGDFRVVVISDVQCSNPQLNTTTLNNIKTVIDKTNPDLVLIAGDNCFNIGTEEDMKTYISNMVGYIEEKQIPWAHVFGNHDDERNVGHSSLPKEEQQKVYESFDYCLSKAGDEDIFGVGNYVLPVLTHDGSKIAFNVWGLDSGHYVKNEDRLGSITMEGNTFMGHYQSMETNQVEWYVETSKMLEEYNGGVVPAMMYFHIPLQEMYAAWNFGTDQTGEQNENISAHIENIGLFSAILDRGDVSLIVNGHDHINDFSAKYRGVTFAYTACIGTEVYHDLDLVGGRVVDFSTDDPTEFNTYMSYVKERTSASYSDPILQLAIGYDGEVSNVSPTGPNVTYNMYDGTTTTVSYDTDINRNKISFRGGNNTPSTYTIPAGGFVKGNLSDGFSFEVLFKVTQAYTGGGYLGIIDQEETGGWGLNILKGTDATKVSLSFEFAVSNGSGGRVWKDIRHEISINEWCHCVGVYDKDNNKTELYVNGTLVGTVQLTQAMVPSAVDYICIGGCAQATHLNRESTGINGFVGDVAVCNILSNPVDATTAKTMYTNTTTKPKYVLNLQIDEEGNVYNGAEIPVLKDFAGTTGTKTVTSDSTINRKFIRFNGKSGNDVSSTYYIPFPTTAGSAIFDDGFAIETMFRITASDYATAIIDHCEGGGVGISYNNGNDKKLLVELAHSTSGYASLYVDVALDTWYHLIVDYNSTTKTLTVYLNGKVVGTKTVTTGYRDPAFGTTAPYISIGSRSDKGVTNKNGFQGDIAIANIYTDSLTSEQMAALYNAAKP